MTSFSSRRRRALVAIAVTCSALAALPATQATAEIIAPIGLAPGSQYQLIFKTDGLRDALSGNIADYNDFVTAEAALNPLLPTATWRAVASTHSVDAIDNAPSVGLPIYDTHGFLVANGNLYTGSLLNGIQFNQFGFSDFFGLVWTGTDTSGHKAFGASPIDTIKLIDFGLGTENGFDGLPHPVVGITHSTDAGWIWNGTAGDGTHLRPLYALSTAITFVPEPASWLLLAAGGVILWFAAQRRRAMAASRT